MHAEVIASLSSLDHLREKTKQAKQRAEEALKLAAANAADAPSPANADLPTPGAPQP